MNKLIKFFFLIFVCVLTSSCLLCHEAQCPNTKQPEFYPKVAIPKVTLVNGVITFQSPPILRRRAHYALHRIHVYDEEENIILWQIQDKNICNFKTADIEKKAQYNPETPIIYGIPLADTEEIISPTALKPNVIYNMSGDFTGFDTKNYQDPPTPVKVTFKLIHLENGQLTVITLPTKTAGSKFPFLNTVPCDLSQKK